MQRSAHADPSHEHLICVCHRPSIHHPHRHHLHSFPPSRRLACSSHRSLDPNSIALRCHQDLSPGQHRRPSIRSTNDVALDVLACLGEFSFTPFVRSLSSHFPSSVLLHTVPYATHSFHQHTFQRADIGRRSHPHFSIFLFNSLRYPPVTPQTRTIRS